MNKQLDLATRRELTRQNAYPLDYAQAIIRRIGSTPYAFFVQLNKQAYEIALQEAKKYHTHTYSAVAFFALNSDKDTDIIERYINMTSTTFYMLAGAYRLYIDSDLLLFSTQSRWKTINDNIFHLEGDNQDIHAFIDFLQMPMSVYKKAILTLADDEETQDCFLVFENEVKNSYTVAQTLNSIFDAGIDRYDGRHILDEKLLIKPFAKLYEHRLIRSNKNDHEPPEIML